MSIQTDLVPIKESVDKLDQNKVARLAYTETAFNTDDVDGVDIFDRNKEQNIPTSDYTEFNSSILQYGIRTQGASLPRMAWNHYIGRTSYNINKLVQRVKELLTVLSSAFKRNGFRYDSTVIYSTGDTCFEVESSTGLITWYRRTNSSPGILADLDDISCWTPLTDATTQGVVENNIVNNLTSEDTNKALSAAMGKELQDSISVIALVAHPIGSIYESVLSTSPATLFGGTWTALGAGRVLVGIDTGDADFNTVEKTGGAKTHTLTDAQMPYHTHFQDWHNHGQDAHSHPVNSAGGGGMGFTNQGYNTIGSYSTGTATATNQGTTVGNSYAGQNGAHNNLQPYIVVYRWKRTA